MKTWKRTVSLLLCLAMMLGSMAGISFAAEIVASGDCSAEGDENDVTWTLDSEGTLRINGTGKMRGCGDPDYPIWGSNRSSITRAIVSGGIANISRHAFAFCPNLISVTILDGVTSIEYGAFCGSHSLISVTIPNSVKSIGEYAFLYCDCLTNVTIPDSVTSIGRSAFDGCEKLTSIRIPNGVTEIKRATFYNCSSLATVTIPDSVTNIDGAAFTNCSSLTSVTIPDGVTSIGDYTFEDCSSLKTVTLPDSLTKIESCAFSGCKSLTNVKIPDGVISIGSFAFSNCSSLTEVTIPDNVTSIDQGVFGNCSSLASITIANSVTSISKSMLNGCSSLTEVKIPDSVTSIGEFAFTGCTSLTSVIIPKNVTSIGSYAFRGCSSLEDISVAVDNTMYSSEDGVLFNKDKTELVRCSTKKEAAHYSIPSSVTMIDIEAFYGCSELTSITIPDGVTVIKYDTFFGDSGLKSITIPNSVTSIEGAFWGCSSLTDVYYTGTEEEWKNINKTRTSNDYLLNATIHYNAVSGETTKQLALISSTPTVGNRKVKEDELSFTFNKSINQNLNWSVGPMIIREYSTGETVLTIDNKSFYSLGGSVSGTTITIPNAFKDLPLGHYYLLVPKNLILAAAVGPDGIIAAFEGFEEYQFDFVLDSDERPRKVTLDFRGVDMTVDWSWAYFSKDARTESIDKDLAIVSLILSAESNTSTMIENNLSALDFHQISTYNYDYDIIDRPAMVIAQTQKEIGGKQKTIIAVSIRGTKNLADLTTDLTAATDGFVPSAEYALRNLNDYIENMNLKPEDTILYISGHSLGGAVAASLALRTTHITSQKNTFVYTFATPNYRIKGYDSNDYQNIITYVNLDDLVPTLPLADPIDKINLMDNGKVGQPIIKYDYFLMSSTRQKNWQDAYYQITGKQVSYVKNLLKCHLAECYMAFLLSDVPTSSRKAYFNVASVRCPVDVAVYNSQGAFMASTTGGQVNYSDDTEVFIQVDGDEKTVILPSDSEYRIELTGTDTGTMQYSAMKVDYDTNEIVEEKTFTDVVLYDGKSMTSTVPSEATVSEVKLYVLDDTGAAVAEVQENGTETPIDAPSHLPGDINNDGVVNNKDLTRLAQRLAGRNVECNEAALDVNGDGVVNNKDLTRLAQHLAGRNVELH